MIDGGNATPLLGAGQDSTDEDDECCSSSHASRAEEPTDSAVLSDKGFFTTFFTAKGAPQILLICFFFSVSVYSTIGIVPDVTADRYARLSHGYSDSKNCAAFDRIQKPQPCQQGADDAQEMAAWYAFARNMLTLISNSIICSFSDSYGRRKIMCLCMSLYTLPSFALVLLQLVPTTNPFWYYIADTSTGLVSWMSICYSMLSDVMPKKLRAPSFGLFLATFYVGEAISSQFPVLLHSHFHVSVLAFIFALGALIVAFFGQPETLPPHIAERNLAAAAVAAARDSAQQSSGETTFVPRWANVTGRHLSRPFQEMAILNRDYFFRLLSAGAFFSGMVYSSDSTLIVYYVEDQLNVRDKDLASMFLIMGLLGIVIQGFLLEHMIRYFGEKHVNTTAFVSGTIHNLLYGLAKQKSTIYVAFCFSQLTKTNFPMISSLASNHVAAHEQGRTQGALFALTALADAIGPVALNMIYSHTKEDQTHFLGPGTMFLCASFLYGIGTVLVSLLPVEMTNTTATSHSHGTSTTSLLEDESDMDNNSVQEALLEDTTP